MIAEKGEESAQTSSNRLLTGAALHVSWDGQARFARGQAGRPVLLESVEGEVEDVEIAQLAGEGDAGVGVVEGAGEDEVDVAVGESAVGTQPHSVQPGQVERGFTLTQHGGAVADDDEIADTVGGKIELSGGGGTIQDEFDSGLAVEEVRGGGGGNRRLEEDGGVRAEGAVMLDIGVGDGEDDPGFAASEFPVEEILEKDDVGGAAGGRLIIHSVVSGEG